MNYIYEEMGNFVIDNENLPEEVAEILLEENITLSSAESCTGGMFAARITNISGISQIFDRGIVTYSNNAKMQELGVLEKTLDSFGAVSRETAEEMAKGIKRVSNTDIGVSVTGIAGPGGATADKPVGLVYICAVNDDISICRKFNFEGDRISNRKNSMLNMYKLIQDLIKYK